MNEATLAIHMEYKIQYFVIYHNDFLVSVFVQSIIILMQSTKELAAAPCVVHQVRIYVHDVGMSLCWPWRSNHLHEERMKFSMQKGNM